MLSPLLLVLAADVTPHQTLARDLFRELMTIDTTHATGSTTVAANAMAKRLRRAGLPAADVKVLGPSPRKGNLVARFRGTGARKPLLLLGHLDVVAADRKDWTIEPFVLTERDGYFYGRGTEDMKSLVALWVATVIRLKQEGHRPDRDVIIALTADEENGDENGVEWLLARHRPLVDAAFALNEGGGGDLKGGKRRANYVQASEKVYLTFELQVRNKGGHSSLPEKENAIVRLGEALARVHRHAFPPALDEINRAYFARMAAHESGDVAAAMSTLGKTRPGQPPEAGAVAALANVPFYNARLRTTCVPTQVTAGHAENALPQRATATVNCRVLPGVKPEDVEAALRAVIADPQVTVNRLGKFDVSPPSPLTPELMTAVEAATTALWPGVPVVPVMIPGATDGRFLRAAGIPTYGVSGLFRDVTDIRAHGKDERIAVQAFFDAQAFVYDLVKRLTTSP